VLAGAYVSADGMKLGAGEYYTWGISGDEVTIAEGSVITEALLTIYGITSITDNSADGLVVSILDNPPPGFVANRHVGGLDPFVGHGCRLLPVYHDTVPGTEEITWRLSEINDEASWVWGVFESPFEVELADSNSITCSSSLLELMDYAGNGTPFGIGIDCSGEGDFGFTGISLVLVVDSFQGEQGRSFLTYSFGDTNRAPVFANLADREVAENTRLTFAVRAEDPEGDDMTLTAENLPAGATFRRGVFRWTPSYDVSSRDYTHRCRVTFIADDGRASSRRTVAITVSNSNRTPVFPAFPVMDVDENAVLSFDLDATDPDGDEIIYSGYGLPRGAQLENGRFTWRPDYDQAGLYSMFFGAADGLDTGYAWLRVWVRNTNRAPVMAPIGAMEVSEGTELSFVVSATDPDGDRIEYRDYGLPRGATFENGRFTWRPDYDQAGLYFLEFSAGDGLTRDYASVQIWVRNAKRRPVPVLIGAKEVDEGAELLP